MKGQTKKKSQTISIHKKVNQTLKNYAEVSTGHGMRYIFEDEGNGFTRLIWASVVVGFIVVTSIISKNAYDDWKNNPILTSVATTGLPIKNIEFPAITLCNQGNLKEVTENVIKIRLEKYVQNTQNISLADIQAKGLEHLKRYLMEFFNTENINIKQALKIFKSINPDATTRASIAQNKIDPCFMNKTLDLYQDSDEVDYYDYENVNLSRPECPNRYECLTNTRSCLFISNNFYEKSEVESLCSSMYGKSFEIYNITDIKVIMDIKNYYRVPLEFHVKLKIDEINLRSITKDFNEISIDIQDYSDPCISVYIAQNMSIHLLNNDCSDEIQFACVLHQYNCRSSAFVDSPDCPKGFWKDGNTCIFISLSKYTKEKYSEACNEMDGFTFQIKEKKDFSVFESILRYKKNLLPKTFYTDTHQMDMNSLSRLLEGNKALFLNETKGECLMVSMNENVEFFKSDCERESHIICVKNLPICPYRKNKESPINQLLLPEKAHYIQQYIGLIRTWIDTFFSELNQDKAYNELFHLLWLDKMPCFDVSEPIQKVSFIKKCWWKKQEIPCSSLFDSFPTDQGLCCVFNLEKAENMFRESKYSTKLSEFQREEKTLSEESSKWVLEDGEPFPKDGKHEGLVVILDANTDLIESTTITSDEMGFYAYVGGLQQYPLLSRHSISIRTGEQNYVKISATDIKTDMVLEQISSEKRNCYFSHEKKLVYFQNYTRNNCLFECELMYGKRHTNCTPWYFPVLDEEINICDPWKTKQFIKLFSEVKDAECDCKPDCKETIYTTSFSSLPFRSCNFLNLGMSYFCDFHSQDLPEPQKFVEDIIGSKTQAYIKSKYVSPIRFISKDVSIRPDSEYAQRYNAFTKDISIVNFFFEKSAILQYQRKEKLTSIEFMGQIGGILGLCIGFSIISFIELIYWFLFKFLFARASE